MSIINREHWVKHIFIHVPKCAGSSMESNLHIGGTGHATLYEISTEIKDTENIDNFFKWTFIRNPFDRVASAWLKMNGKTRKEKEVKEICDTFEHFVFMLPELIKESRSSKSIDPYNNILHVQPLDYFIEFDNHKMDFIGKLENIEKDYKILCDKLQIIDKLPHTNKSKGEKSYLRMYSNEMIDLMLKLYDYDMKFYP